ncbi:hypothetical protein NA78x_001421 [Anatilimnocola sp. NA78]|uniref:hypothetical protein n=1 Tax=Anatilimnocola sp. NA78 TaxID=3415683 RepID=UPI003CE50226
MITWAARLPRSAATGLGALRFLSGAEACIVDDAVWLRGRELSEADQLRLRQLPGAERFQVNERQEIISFGALLPVGILPTAEWERLSRFLTPVLIPALTTVGVTRPSVSLILVRDTQQREVAALITSIAAWHRYVETAPQVRLSKLKFAASDAGQVLIVGTPLPPIDGARYWEEAGIYCAAGLRWQPAVDAQVVRKVLELGKDEIAVWHANGDWELVRTIDFVGAKRVAVRATAEGLANVSR